MKELRVTILCAPAGKQRARTVRHGDKVITYTPDKTAHLENLIRDKVTRQGVYFEKGVPLEIISLFVMERPKSAPKKRVYPTVVPDIDNMQKLLLDSLKGFAYDNDSQIIKETARKSYGYPPRIEFYLKEFKED